MFVCNNNETWGRLIFFVPVSPPLSPLLSLSISHTSFFRSYYGFNLIRIFALIACGHKNSSRFQNKFNKTHFTLYARRIYNRNNTLNLQDTHAQYVIFIVLVSLYSIYSLTASTSFKYNNSNEKTLKNVRYTQVLKFILQDEKRKTLICEYFLYPVVLFVK